jgi:hypothetical protein
LGKKPFPSIYINYIGWIPVLFALLALRLVPRESIRVLVFFLVAIGLAYVASSAAFFKLVSGIVPNLTGARHPSLIATLAVPLVLALTAWGFDLASKLNGVRLTIGLSPGASAQVNLWSVGLGLLALLAVKSTYDFSQTWTLVPTAADAYAAVRAVQIDHSEWVEVPRSRHDIFLIALESNLKVGFHPDERGWMWRGKDLVPAYLTMTTDPVTPQTTALVKRVDNVNILLDQRNEYASIDSGGSQIPCRAQALGGTIDVACENERPGILIVREYQWTGWNAWIDGVASPLEPSQWLSVALPSGRHTIAFRYQPLDALAGAILSLVGVGLSVFLWRRST